MRILAQKQLARERRNHTLQKTSLVHEVFLKLVNQSEVDWEDRNHFFAIASRCMRQVLVDYARKKTADKRGGKLRNITLKEDFLNSDHYAEELIELNDLIEKLSEFDERKGKVAEMRIFGELTIQEISEVLKLSSRTIKRDWMKAKGWLIKELKRS